MQRPHAREFVALLALSAIIGACGRDERPASSDAPAVVEPRPPPAATIAPPLRFTARRERALAGKPEGLVAADLDGDGASELSAVTIAPDTLASTLVVWRGAKTGLARDMSVIPCGDWPLEPLALAAGSFGAPPKQRWIAVASRGQRALEILDTLADPAAARRARVELLQIPRALASGDLGRDGVRELVLACDEKSLVVVSERGLALQRFALRDELPRCALVLSDGSGVLVGFQSTKSVQLYRCHAPDEPPALVLELDGFPRALAELDLDGDGDTELAVAGGDRSLWVFGLARAGGVETWADPVARSSFSVDAIPLALAGGDFDGDGRADLAVLHAYDLNVALLAGWKASGPSSQQRASCGQTPADVAALDFDGDGRLDVAIANRDTLGVGLLPGDGRGGLALAETVPVGQFPNSIAAGELFGDAKSELFVLNSKDHSLSVIARAADGWRANAAIAVGSEPRAVRCADLDGDGFADAALLVTDAQGARVVELFGDGHGALAARAAFPELAAGRAGDDLLLADLDGDRRPELAVADHESGAVWLVQSSTPRVARRFAVASSPVALEAIQLDADPEPEIAVVLGAPGERTGIALLDSQRAADGALSLREIASFAVAGAPLDVASGDLDGDGRADLVVLYLQSPGSVEGWIQPWLRKAGSELAFVAGDALPTGQNPHHLVCGDADGDGRADVFVAAQNSHLVNGWRSKRASSGALELERLDDLGAGRGPLDLTLCDLDGDGRPDLAIANAFSNDVSLIRGRRE